MPGSLATSIPALQKRQSSNTKNDGLTETALIPIKPQSKPHSSKPQRHGAKLNSRPHTATGHYEEDEERRGLRSPTRTPVTLQQRFDEIRYKGKEATPKELVSLLAEASNAPLDEHMGILRQALQHSLSTCTSLRNEMEKLRHQEAESKTSMIWFKNQHEHLQQQAVALPKALATISELRTELARLRSQNLERDRILVQSRRFKKTLLRHEVMLEKFQILQIKSNDRELVADCWRSWCCAWTRSVKEKMEHSSKSNFNQNEVLKNAEKTHAKEAEILQRLTVERLQLLQQKRRNDARRVFAEKKLAEVQSERSALMHRIEKYEMQINEAMEENEKLQGEKKRVEEEKRVLRVLLHEERHERNDNSEENSRQNSGVLPAGTETIGTQTEHSRKKGPWSAVLGELERSLEKSFQSSGKTIHGFIETWALSNEFSWEASKVVLGEEKAACFIQRLWRAYRSGEDLQRAAKNWILEQSRQEHQYESMQVQKYKMIHAYQLAFQNAGGNESVERYRERSEELIGKLQEARSFPHRQDVGFQIMDLEELLAVSGTKSVKLRNEVQRIADMTGGVLLFGKIKSHTRSRNKVMRKYGGDVSCLTDCMRASISYPSIDALYNGLFNIIEMELEPNRPRRDFFVLDIEDRVLHDAGGYRDIEMNVVVDGVVGELQLHLEPVLKAKKSGTGHKVYESLRLTYEVLLEASIHGHSRVVERLVRSQHLSGEDAKDKNGRTAMHYCCYWGFSECLYLLTHHGGDVWVGDRDSSNPQAHGVLPVELALNNCHLDTLKVMLRLMLRYPARKTPGPALQRFLERVVLWWVDFAAGSTFHYSGEDLSIEIFSQCKSDEKKEWMSIGQLCREIIVKYDQHNTLEHQLEAYLRNAAAAGQASRVTAFLMMGISPFGNGKHTALDVALTSGEPAAARVIADFVGPNQPTGGCRQPLPFPGIAQHLLQAALNENESYASAALSAKADPSASASYGRTALMLFAAAGNMQICKQLLDADADACAEDSYGCRPSQYARALGHDALSQFLQGQEKRKPRARFPKLGSLYGTIAREGCAASVWRFVIEQNQGMPVSELLNMPLEGGLAPTALLIAVEQACKESAVHTDPSGQVYRALLHWRADPSVADARGETPLHAAALRENMKVYFDLFDALSKLHGPEKAVQFVQTNVNQAGQTCNALLQNREYKTEARREADVVMNNKLLQFTFVFWKMQRCLSAVGWHDVWEKRNSLVIEEKPEMALSSYLDLQGMRSGSQLADHSQPLKSSINTVVKASTKEFEKVQPETNPEESTGHKTHGHGHGHGHQSHHLQHKTKSEGSSSQKHHRHKSPAHKGEHEDSEKETAHQQKPKRKLIEA